MIWCLNFMSVSPWWANYWETPDSMAMWKTIQGQSTLMSLMLMTLLTSLMRYSQTCCQINSIHITIARFLSRQTRITFMQPISRHAWDILGTADAVIYPAPAGLEVLLPHLQIEWANRNQRKITENHEGITITGYNSLVGSQSSHTYSCKRMSGMPDWPYERKVWIYDLLSGHVIMQSMGLDRNTQAVPNADGYPLLFFSVKVGKVWNSLWVYTYSR